MNDDICKGCGHSIGEHFRSVDDKVRCLQSSSGTSTHGIIGMPYVNRCDCVDFKSPNTDQCREKHEREQREQEERLDKSMEELRGKFPEIFEGLKHLKKGS